MRHPTLRYGVVVAMVAGLAVDPASAQQRPGVGFRGGGGAGFGIGLGVGLGAAAIGGLLSQSRGGDQSPSLIESNPDQPPIRIRTPPRGDGPPPPRGGYPRHPRVSTSAETPTHTSHRTHKPIRIEQQTPPTQRVQTPVQGPRLGFVVPASTEQRYVPDEVLVVTRGTVSAAILRRIEAAAGLTSLATAHIDLLDADIRRYRLRPGASVAATIAGLRGQRAIVGAEPNYLFALQEDAPAPPSAPTADAAKTASPEPGAAAAPVQYAVTSLRLDTAHKVATGDAVLIAVIDSGIDESNPELAGMIAERFDAVGGTFAPQAHGTAMAGAIVAHRTLVGAAPKARLLAIRAFTGGTQSATGTGYDVLRGLDFAAAHGARIVNLSFAGPRDELLEEALIVARGRGITALAAAGNGGPQAKPLYPAASPGVIAVTATDADGKPFAQANRGDYIAVAAPGVNVVAPGLGGSVQLSSGTSIAAAEASGVAALILERRKTAGPDEVRRILTGTAHKLASEPAAGGAGLIDAAGAVAAVK